MPDEEKETQEEATAEQATLPSMNEEFGDDALDRAAESAVEDPNRQEEPAVDAAEEKVEETPAETVEAKEDEDKEEAEEEVVADPVVDDDEAKEDHKERTRLGRKVAKHDEMMAAIAEQNAKLLEVISKIVPKPEPEAESEEEEGPFEGFQTKAELNAYLDQRDRARENKVIAENRKYSESYLASLNKWQKSAEESEDSGVAEVYKLLVDESEGAEFNVKHPHLSPADGFALNLARAEAHYFKEKHKSPTKKSPLKNDPAKAPLGGGGGDKVEPSKAKGKVKLDPAALDFLKSTPGVTEEEAAEYLAGATPAYLRRGR